MDVPVSLQRAQRLSQAQDALETQFAVLVDLLGFAKASPVLDDMRRKVARSKRDQIGPNWIV